MFGLHVHMTVVRVRERDEARGRGGDSPPVEGGQAQTSNSANVARAKRPRE